MNKSLYGVFLVFLCLTLCPLFAEFQSSVEIRSAAFFYSSERFREIYGNVGASYHMEASTKLHDCLDGWANLDRPHPAASGLVAKIARPSDKELISYVQGGESDSPHRESTL